MGFIARGKTGGAWFDHSPSSDEVMNGYSCNSAPSPRLHGMVREDFCPFHFIFQNILVIYFGHREANCKANYKFLSRSLYIISYGFFFFKICFSIWKQIETDKRI